MIFQHPSFLWALLLLAVPIIIHLFNFRKYKRVLFSNVAMLKEIQTESRKTKQIKKWLILLSRLLALAALVLAFARPYLPNKSVKDGRQLVSIYLDNSQSMKAEGENGQLFENAKNAARLVIENLPKDAEIQVIDNGLSPYTNRIHTPSNAIKLIDDMEIDFHPNDINSIIQKINNKFISEGYASQHTFAITDFQTQTQQESSQLDSNLILHFLRSTPSTLQNLSIDSVWLEEPVVKPGAPVMLRVKVVNNGTETVESTSVILKINGVQQGVESFRIQGKSEEIMSLAFSSSQKGWVDGEVSLTDVPVVFDNQYFFTLNIKPTINILEIGQKSAEIAKIFGSDAVFNFIHTSEGTVDYAGLDKYDFIILNELTEVGSGLAEQLKQFTQKGGIVTILPGANATTYNSLSSILGLSAYGNVIKNGLSITSKDLNQPFIRDVYKKIPQNILLPKVIKSYKLKSIGGTQSVLSLKDNTTILARKRIGTGSVFQFSIPLDKSFSNLGEHELFVLTMLKMAFSKSEKQQLAYTVFSDKAISIPEAATTEATVTLVLGSKSVLGESAAHNGGFRFWLNDELDQAGIYSVQNSTQKQLAKIALNYSRSESVQRFSTDDQLRNQFPGVEINLTNSSTSSIKEITDSLNSGRPLWKLFVLLCLIFLLIEILLLRFLK